MKKILSVDDDPISHFIITRLIQNFNKDFNVITYTNPQEAFDNISLINPDIIFLDLHMPLMDGFMFLRTMREHNLNYPVYVVTSSTFESDKEMVAEFENVKQLLVKPLSAKVLLEALGN